MTKKKYLIDTSAVRPALGFSTSQHCEHFRQETEGGSLWTSVYIRMEFIRVWFCEFARIAFTIEHFNNVEQAMYFLEQEFSQRRNKSDIAGIGSFVNQIGPLRNCRAAAEEFASLAMRWLKTFDFVFPARIRNGCRCQIGGKTPNVDYNHFLADLHRFYEFFQTHTDKSFDDLCRVLGRDHKKILSLRAIHRNLYATLNPTKTN